MLLYPQPSVWYIASICRLDFGQDFDKWILCSKMWDNTQMYDLQNFARLGYSPAKL